MQKSNVWRGKEAIREFLNPENHVTPLIELDEELNPFFNRNIHIFIKMQTFLPLMNVKCLPAYQMLKDCKVQAKGLVEASSGNMAFSLSILGKYFGFEKVRAIISNKLNLEKLKMLLLAGAEVYVNQEPVYPKENYQDTGIAKAKKMVQEEEWQNLNQYGNASNPKGHFEICAQQLIEQMSGDIQVFCSSLGTTGSISGIATLLKQYNTQMIGVVSEPADPVPGPRTLEELDLVEFDWQKNMDDVITQEAENAYIQSLKLCRQGILVGPSTGLNLAGLLTYLERKLQEGTLEKLRNKNHELNCVILACDLPFLYLDEYFKHIPKSYFATMHHQDLLLNQIHFKGEC